MDRLPSPVVSSRWRGLHYAWVVAAVTFVTLLAAAGFRSTPAVLIVPLHDDLGWSRATISLAVSVNLLCFGLIAPFAAALMGRFGLRRVVLTALAMVTAGSGLTVFATAPWHLIVLWGVVVGLGTGCMAVVLAATIASRWFVAKRGLVTGTLTAASATGQLVFLPLLALLATEHGWRTVSLTVAGCTAAVVPLVALLLRDRPEDLGLKPYGAPADHQPPPPVLNPVRTTLTTLADVVRSRAFWLLAGSFWVCGASTNGLIGTHFIAASVDHGMPEASGAALLALVGVFDVGGTIASGWLTDRVDPRTLLFFYYGLRGLSLLVLHDALGSGSIALWLFVVFYGLDWVATVPPTVVLVNRVFGPASGPIVFGWVFTAHQLGAAAAAGAAGAVRTWTGSYHWAFVSAGVLCLAAAVGVLGLGRHPSRPTPAPQPSAPVPAGV